MAARIALNRKSLTLLEILVSCLLISIAVIGIYNTFAWTDTMSIVNRCQVQAADFGKELMEQLMLIKYSDLDDIVIADKDLPVGSALKDVFSGSRTYNITENPGAEQYKIITVTVTWKEKGVNKNIVLYGRLNP